MTFKNAIFNRISGPRYQAGINPLVAAKLNTGMVRLLKKVDNALATKDVIGAAKQLDEFFGEADFISKKQQADIEQALADSQKTMKLNKLEFKRSAEGRSLSREYNFSLSPDGLIEWHNLEASGRYSVGVDVFLKVKELLIEFDVLALSDEYISQKRSGSISELKVYLETGEVKIVVENYGRYVDISQFERIISEIIMYAELNSLTADTRSEILRLCKFNCLLDSLINISQIPEFDS